MLLLLKGGEGNVLNEMLGFKLKLCMLCSVQRLHIRSPMCETIGFISFGSYANVFRFLWDYFSRLLCCIVGRG